MNKEKLKKNLKTTLRFIFNPKLLFCLLAAWMVTNGWSYVMMGLGILLDISWMKWVSGAYLGLLWLPFTPEKIITVAIAIFLLKLLFPNDQSTLKILNDLYNKVKEKLKKKLKEKSKNKQKKT